MKHFIILTLTAFVFLAGQTAHADIIPDTCVMNDENAITLEANLDTPLQIADIQELQLMNPTLFSSAYGIRCENLRLIAKGAAITGVVVTSLRAAYSNPAVAAAVSARLVALGIAPGGAAVAVVTIVGAIGVSVAAYVLTDGIDECAQMDEEKQNQLLKSLEDQIGALRTQQTKIQVQP